MWQVSAAAAGTLVAIDFAALAIKNVQSFGAAPGGAGSAAIGARGEFVGV
jgi:hypothetical protein